MRFVNGDNMSHKKTSNLQLPRFGFFFLDAETILTAQLGVEEEPRRQYFG